MRSSGSSSGTPSHSRSTSRYGQYGRDSPYETQRPSSQSGAPCGDSAPSKRVRSSPLSLLLPIPASPVMKRTPPVPPSTASAASPARASCSSRPTNGVSTPSKPRTRPGTARTPVARQATTAFSLPLRSSSCGSLQSKRGSTRLYVGSPTSIVPGAAAFWSRAAVLIVSPVAPYSTREPPPTGPRTTEPVLTPTRTAKPSTPQPAATSDP